MAYVKQTWENLPSTNTPITAERLNHMEDGIDEAWQHGEGGAGETLPVGSEIEFTGEAADIPEGWEYSEDDYNEYSEDEKRIGTWIDGKPIYRKVLLVNNPSSRNITLNPNIDLDKMIQVSGFAKRTNSYMNPIPCIYSSWEIFAYDFSGNHINVVFSTNQWNAGVDYFYLILEYTKTTD